MSFDFSNNIEIDVSTELINDDAVLKVANDVLRPFDIEAKIGNMRSTIYLYSDLGHINYYYVFLSFLALYDRLSGILPTYKWNAVQAFSSYWNLVTSVRHLASNILVSNMNLASAHKDLVINYFQYQKDISGNTIKLDVPMILSYFLYINRQLLYLADEDKNKYTIIRLYEPDLNIHPVILSKEELWQILLTVTKRCYEFCFIHVSNDFRQLLVDSVWHHYHKDISMAKLPYQFTLLCNEIFCELYYRCYIKPPIPEEELIVHIFD